MVRATVLMALLTTAIAAPSIYATNATAAPPPLCHGPCPPPAVDMGSLVIAAQLDEYRLNNGTTSGAADDVQLVQRALRNRGFVVAVDGNFGAQTTAAYAAWQRKLGYSRLGANGLPGHASLKRLGLKLINEVTPPGQHGSYNGTTLNKRTIDMLAAARKNLGCKRGGLKVTHGSYRKPGGKSAGTHAGGGAVDISIRKLCGRSIDQVDQVLSELTKVGFAAWYRDWPNNRHIHAIAISDLDMSTESAVPGEFDAREQIVAWAQGKDGLGRAEIGPMTREKNLTTWEDYNRAR